MYRNNASKSSTHEGGKEKRKTKKIEISVRLDRLKRKFAGPTTQGMSDLTQMFAHFPLLEELHASKNPTHTFRN